MHSAEHHDRWLACACRGAAVAPPLLTPAYMTVAQTYYLRPLTGTGRPPHGPTCPFPRDQADYLRDRSERGRAAVTPPQGYFAVLARWENTSPKKPQTNWTPLRAAHRSRAWRSCSGF